MNIKAAYINSVNKWLIDYFQISIHPLTWSKKNKYQIESFSIADFISALESSGSSVNINYSKKLINKAQILEQIKNEIIPIILFLKNNGEVFPIIITQNENGKSNAIYSCGIEKQIAFDEIDINQLVVDENNSDEVIAITPFANNLLFSDPEMREGDDAHTETQSIKRFFRLLKYEKRDIVHIFIYALFVGLISLSLPLGTQAIVSMISGSLIIGSVYVLIALILSGILVSGIIQIFQIHIVEIIQQRIFTKVSFEFAGRISKLKLEAIFKHYMPEMVNRFFDVLTIQKGFAKILLDITTASMQILFGLILLDLYHSMFVFFGLLLVVLLFLIIRFTAPAGLKASMYESKFKYKVVHWLQDLARSITTFKLAGTTNLPVEKTDELVSEYLHYRKKHFNVLLWQYYALTGFKTILAGGVLIIGSILVVNQEITLAQFVAAELVIITINSATEKLIKGIDLVYDILTASEKIGNVTDIPIEDASGIILDFNATPIELKAENLSYRFSNSNNHTLNNLSLSLSAGDSVCLVGTAKSGKHTLFKVLSGLYNNYEGSITYNNFSLRDLNKNHLHNYISFCLADEQIFSGTLEENITLGRTFIDPSYMQKVIEKINLSDYINELPNGMKTQLLSEGLGLTSLNIKKIIIARALVNKPKLLFFENILSNSNQNEKEKIISFVLEEMKDGILIMVASHPEILKRTKQIYFMDAGKIILNGTYDTLIQNKNFASYITSLKIS